jgi:hypothetical protein
LESREFGVSYANKTISVNGGPELTVSYVVQPHQEINAPGSKASDFRGILLPGDAPPASFEEILKALSDSPPCKVYPLHDPDSLMEAASISSWYVANSRVCGGGLSFTNDTSSNGEVIVTTAAGVPGPLYDRQYSKARAQYLVAGTFGLMQFGILNFDPGSNERSQLLRDEYDLGAPERHILDQVLFPEISMRLGAALDSYLLYRDNGFETLCPDTCSHDNLSEQTEAMLQDYNGSSAYPGRVLRDIYLFSDVPGFWGQTAPSGCN